jgi:hypothetical protein
MTVEAVVEHQFVSQNFLYRIHVPVDARAGQWTGRKGHPQVVSYLHLLLPGLPFGLWDLPICRRRPNTKVDSMMVP